MNHNLHYYFMVLNQFILHHPLKLKIIHSNNNILIRFIGPGPVCNGSNYNDLSTCCTKEEPCDEWEGACNSDDECMGPLECGHMNCDVTSIITNYGGNQKFNCCYSSMYFNNKKMQSSTYCFITTFLLSITFIEL